MAEVLLEPQVDVKCFHCGQPCEDVLLLDEKAFCCQGCKTVYEILSANDLCEYYGMDEQAGVSRRNVSEESFRYLDETNVRKKILDFESASFAKVTFVVPAIHCVSCIWLLEKLQTLEKGIIRAEVVFGKKVVRIDYNPEEVSLSRVASLLASLGYAPVINLDSASSKKSTTDKSLVYRLSIAGFAFGNVMLFSFPEYLGLDGTDRVLMRTFSWLNLALSIPVFFYSAWGYFTASVNSFKQREINIDVPIAAGLLALFLRSSYDIITATGPGYLDSFTGLVFFLLIGRWFQGKTYESLSFDRDFKAYFPLAVNKLIGTEWKPIIIYELRKGDHIKVRNMEIVPADSVLLDDHAYFDYSFVTGESKPTKVTIGQTVYAGGRLIGNSVELTVTKATSQSHLTSLWNNDAFKKVNESNYQKIIDRAARRFTWIVMGIAVVTAVFWSYYMPEEMWLVLTSVLMVACPCALALAAPFTYGSMLRVFGKHKLYLKNADVIERLATIDAVVFDKTGTVTHGQKPEVKFNGYLDSHEIAAVKALVMSSTHPLSMMLAHALSAKPLTDVRNFKEIPGRGLEGIFAGDEVRVGSYEFTGSKKNEDPACSYVYVAVNGKPRGEFSIRIKVRENIKDMLDRLGRRCIALLSGDNEADRVKMQALFSPSVQLKFNQSPYDKLAFVEERQKAGNKVLMVGDGLNDSGALKQSDVGIAVTDDTGVFTPACDGILHGENITLLDRYIALARSSSVILKTGFGISFFYNAIALTFAVTGHLTPLVAAILMPISSVSVVGFTTLAVNFTAKTTLKESAI